MIDYQLLELLTQNSFDTLVLIGLDEKIKFISNSVINLNGYTSEERIGQDFAEFIHPDDRDYVLREFRERRDKTVKVEFRLRHRNGHWVWVASIAKDFSNHPLINGIVVNSRNITERKATEERLIRQSAIIEHSPFMVLMTDTKGKILYVNPYFEKLTGYSAEEIKGKTPNVLKSGKHSAEFYANIWDILSKGQRWQGQLYNKTKNGKFYWESADIFSVNNHQNQPICYVKSAQDITDQMQIIQALRDSQKRNEDLFNAGPVALTEADLSGVHRIIDQLVKQGISDYESYLHQHPEYAKKCISAAKIIKVNRAATKLLKFDTPQDLTDNIHQFYYKKVWREVLNVLIQVIQNISDVSEEIDFADKEGNDVYIILEAKIIESDFKRVIFSLTNITERKRAEKKLRESQDRLSKVMIAANDGMWDWNLKTNKVYFDPRYYQMAGYDYNEFNASLEEFQKRVHPEDLDYVMDEVKKHLEGKTERYVVEFRFREKNGEWLWVMGRGIIVEKDHKGIPTRFVGTHTDIHQRKTAELSLAESEAKFKAIVNNSAEGLIILNQNQEVEYVSPSYLKMSGFYPTNVKKKAKREDIFAQVHPDDKEPLSRKIEEAIGSRKHRLTYTFRVMLKNGRYIRRKDKATFVYDESGNFKKAYIVCSDISREYAQQQLIRKQNHELQQSNATKDRFISVLAHDLRGPFNSILGFSNLLFNKAKDLDMETIETYAGNINRTASYTFNLLDNLLEWSVVQSDQKPFLPETINLSELIMNTCRFMEQISKNKQIRLETNLPEVLNIEADKEMLRTVLRNLISNALKYTPNRGCVNISAKLVDQQVEICVADTGIGMSEEIRQSLFRAGEKVIQQGIQGEKGTGFGLLLSKDFVAKHRGCIQVESKPHEGSVFTVCLPQKQPKIE